MLKFPFSMSAFRDDFVASQFVFGLILIMTSAMVSLSITRFAASRVASIVATAPYLNLLAFASLLMLQYAMFVFWSPIIIIIHVWISAIPYFIEKMHLNIWSSVWDSVSAIPMMSIQMLLLLSQNIHSTIISPLSGMSDIFSYPPAGVLQIDMIRRVTVLVNLIPNLIRFLITAVFVASFFLKTIQLPIMTLWARIIESNKPVFTLLFGGGATIVKIIHEVAVLVHG